MSLRQTLSIIAALLISAPASATSAWGDYDALLSRQCPSRHADLIVDGQYLDFLNSFEYTLPPAMQLNAKVRADIQHKCGGEQQGFSCEMARSLEAYRTLKLMHRFVAYTCHSVRCEEAGICSQFPKASP